MLLESAQDAFQIIISIGAGTGLLYLLRWLWWRINAWCEVVAMVAHLPSRSRSSSWRRPERAAVRADRALSVAFTTVVLAGDRLLRTPPSREQRWSRSTGKCIPRVRAGRRSGSEAGVRGGSRAAQDHIGMATLGWVSGCVDIWSSLFAMGKFLYGRTGSALILTAVFVVSGAVLVYVVNTLWDTKQVSGG